MKVFLFDLVPYGHQFTEFTDLPYPLPGKHFDPKIAHKTYQEHIEAWKLMDELGFVHQLGARMGYLDAQLLRAIRVIVDVGMHLRRRCSKQRYDRSAESMILPEPPAWQSLFDRCGQRPGS